MGSFKGTVGIRGPIGAAARKPKRQGFPRIESLEDRRLLTGGSTDVASRRSGRRPPPISSTPRTARWPTWASSWSTSTRRSCSSGGNTSQLAAEFPQDRVPERDGRDSAQEPGRRLQPVPQPAHQRRHADHGTRARRTAWSRATCRSTSCRRSPSWRRPRAARSHYNPIAYAANTRASPTTRPRPRCSPTSPARSSTSTARA